MEERTVQDFQTISNRLAGKIFYEINPKNQNQYRTIRMHLNPFCNRVTPQYTQYVDGSPPEGMQIIPPLLLSSLMRFQNTQPNMFY